MEIILGDDDFLDIGRGDWMKGMGEGACLGEMGTCSVWGPPVGTIQCGNAQFFPIHSSFLQSVAKDGLKGLTLVDTRCLKCCYFVLN